MKLTLAQVRHVANLARLELSDEEAARAQQQLSAILEAVEQLSAVDTSSVPATTSVVAPQGRTRPDEVTGHLGVEKALANAPQRVGTSFAIPRVIE